jgi:phospholipid/cholesterol/gamma-HCH transport system ATP-binding protein
VAANSNAVVPHEIAAGVPSGSTQLSEVLQFSQVTVSFDNKPALTDISIDVRLRDTVVLLGAAGSGKTVLLKTAIGLIRPDRGLVRLFGENVTKRREEELFSLRQRVGVLFHFRKAHYSTQ